MRPLRPRWRAPVRRHARALVVVQRVLVVLGQLDIARLIKALCLAVSDVDAREGHWRSGAARATHKEAIAHIETDSDWTAVHGDAVVVQVVNAATSNFSFFLHRCPDW